MGWIDWNSSAGRYCRAFPRPPALAAKAHMIFAAVVVSPFFAFQQSDWVGRFIVMFLVLVSILAWTIVIDKWVYLRTLKRQMKSFLKFYSQANSPIELFLHLDTCDGPLRGVAERGLDGLAGAVDLDPEELVLEMRRTGLPSGIGALEMATVDSSIEAGIDDEILRMEERLGLLGSIVSAAPFVGLLGTVWGVMMAFTGMAAQGKADINALAPGVSGALLTTVVALLVAIPALVGYNGLTTQIRAITVDMENFSADFINSLRVHCQARDPE
jgi:biopolymer transport protein TolQ